MLREGGWFFLHRYRARGEDEDLNLAASTFERARRDAPPDADSRQAPLSDLAVVLRARFERWGRRDDIDRAVALHREARRAAADSDDAQLFAHEENLANALWSRYQHLGTVEDLNEAVTLHERTARVLHARPVERSAVFNNLALVLQARYEHTGEIVDLEAAVTTAREAVEEGVADPDSTRTTWPRS